MSYLDSQLDRNVGSSEERLLRIAFLAGAITDVAALLPMLIPRLAGWVWGLRDVCLQAALLVLFIGAYRYRSLRS